MSSHQDQYYLLECPCPACPKDTVMRKWKHHKCGHRVELNSKAELRCCDHKEDSPIFNWRFACSNHAGDFRNPDPLALVEALTMMRTSANTEMAADRRWYHNLSKALNKMIQDSLDKEEEQLMAEELEEKDNEDMQPTGTK